eukprot:ctg_1830.g482
MWWYGASGVLDGCAGAGEAPGQLLAFFGHVGKWFDAGGEGGGGAALAFTCSLAHGARGGGVAQLRRPRVDTGAGRVVLGGACGVGDAVGERAGGTVAAVFGAVAAAAGAGGCARGAVHSERHAAVHGARQPSGHHTSDGQDVLRARVDGARRRARGERGQSPVGRHRRSAALSRAGVDESSPVGHRRHLVGDAIALAVEPGDGVWHARRRSGGDVRFEQRQQ